MSRRAVVLWSVAVTAATATVALTVPALASDQGTAPPGGAGQIGAVGTDSAPEVLAALQRDLKLTAGQAGVRLHQEAWATGTTASLKAKLGSGYGGAWLSTDAARLTVAVTTTGAADTVRKAGATPVMVARSAATLNTLKKQLDAVPSRPSSALLSGWYADPKTNQVVVVARPGGQAAARTLLARAGVPAGAARVVQSSAAPRPLADIRGGDPYIIDQQARCSVGFSVTVGFVTAGHCGQPGSKTATTTGQAQGTFTASQFPGSGDFALVTVNGGFTPQPVVNDFNGGTVPVAGSQVAPVGASVCRSGSTSGTHCGVIQALNQTVNYPEGTVTGLTQTDVCAEPGDSGGPWLSGDQAQGVTSGGSGDCTVGGTTFFQPLAEILATDNVTLVTTGAGGAGGGGGTTPAPTAAPTDDPTPVPTNPDTPAPSAPSGGGTGPQGCASLQASTNGSLSRTGALQVKPTSGYFHADSGQQVGCLAGPSGANFDLYLQRWTGRHWQAVAQSTGPTSAESLTFRGKAGFYRYVVLSVKGSGAYTLGADIP
jgi:streptogrisin C